MKSTTLLPIFLLLLSAFIVSHLPSATAADVLDTDGDRIRNGFEYYMVSAIPHIGGVKLAMTRNETCPLTIVQAKNAGDDGELVIISSQEPAAIIKEGLPLYLSFAPVPKCAPTPSEWTVVEGLPARHALKITGYDRTVSASFAIRRSFLIPNSYKLTFCPLYSHSCADVGVHVDDNGQRSLVLIRINEMPILVRFKKPRFSPGWIEKA